MDTIIEPQESCGNCNNYEHKEGTSGLYNRYRCPKFVSRDIDSERDDRCLNFEGGKK